jgi:sulfide:quinone oxidoreductase
MKILKVNKQFSISDQVTPTDIQELAELGVRTLVCNRPDGEVQDQVDFESISIEAKSQGIEAFFIPFKSGHLTDGEVVKFQTLLKTGSQIHAYCRTGNRSFNLIAATEASLNTPKGIILDQAKAVGIDVSASIKPYFDEPDSEVSVMEEAKSKGTPSYDVVIIGAGSGGISAAYSLLKRNAKLRIAIVDPAEKHYYQPGWTMVGGGVFDAASTCREMKDLIPNTVSWINKAVVSFFPKQNEITLSDEQVLHYKQLIVCPGLVLNWSAIKGLEETLGKNGVTSNYAYKLAPYTWELVKNLKKGKAIFSQPPMPIKCAGAPQKALYLSCDHWLRSGVLENIDVNFFNAGGVLFGVKEYVPALQSYIDKYSANVHYTHNLVEVVGENKVAKFKNQDGEISSHEFDMIHVCPPQQAPEFVAKSELSDEAGWLDVDQYTLQHLKFKNVWGLGDVMNTPNAKTMAAVRKQVPVVAQNICDIIDGKEPGRGYDGYGSCPLTVEKGKIVLAEFGYGGKLAPSFPSWLLNGTQPTRAAWILKADLLPPLYWHAMLKGREWLVAPRLLAKVKA